MIMTTVFLTAIVLLIIFSIYIVGVISSKLDLVVYYLKILGLQDERIEKDDIQKQFDGMMNYTAEEWRDSDE